MKRTLTYERHLRLLARAAAAATRLQDKARAEQILAASYGAEGHERGLAGIGVTLGITRERTRQIFDRVKAQCDKRSPEAQSILALDREIRAQLPATQRELERAFRKQLGRNATPEDVMACAHEVLGAPEPPYLKVQKVKLYWGGRAIKIDRDEAWAAMAYDVASTMTQDVGGAFLEAIAGRLAFAGHVVPRQQLVDVLRAHPTFIWLHAPSGWCAVDGNGTSRLEQRLAKMLAAAPTSGLTVDDVLESSAVEPPRRQAQRDMAPRLPYAAVVERLNTIDWIEVDHHHRIRSAKRLDRAATLSASELAMIEATRARGGVATTEELILAVRKAGASESAGRQMLRLTPILRRVAPDKYIIRGTHGPTPKT